jgi:hypothetical protein
MQQKILAINSSKREFLILPKNKQNYQGHIIDGIIKAVLIIN